MCGSERSYGRAFRMCGSQRSYGEARRTESGIQAAEYPHTEGQFGLLKQ
jgi:hypothetical protein